MDITAILGIISAFFALIVGIILKGGNPSILISPAAFVIIIIGTISCLMSAFPKGEIKKIFTLFKIVYKEQKITTEKELLPLFVEWARIVRREGIIGLEKELPNISHPFLKKGFELVLEGQDSKDIEMMLEDDLAATEERHGAYASIFTQAGTYAPTLGVMGAVMGLIGALGELNDMDKLGHSIAAAFVATMLGIFTGYMVWHPMANKLKRKSKREIEIGYFIIKGIVSIQEDASPLLVERKLLPYLPSKERNLKKVDQKAGDE